ncbi:MAG: hypothetical protein QXL96_03710 [Ignisphaera sp.]
MSSVIQAIEAEAVSIIEDAKKKAQKIVDEAKAKAKEILDDRSYLDELAKYRKEIEEKLRKEIEKILEEAQIEASMIKHRGSKKAEVAARKIASMVAGIEI